MIDAHRPDDPPGDADHADVGREPTDGESVAPPADVAPELHEDTGT